VFEIVGLAPKKWCGVFAGNLLVWVSRMVLNAIHRKIKKATSVKKVAL